LENEVYRSFKTLTTFRQSPFDESIYEQEWCDAEKAIILGAITVRKLHGIEKLPSDFLEKR